MNTEGEEPGDQKDGVTNKETLDTLLENLRRTVDPR